MKKWLIIASVALLVVCGVGAGFLFYQDSQEKSSIRQQIEDVNKKIAELPELEEDIFAKCMEGAKGKAEEIAKCQEKTQSSMHTLAQDLSNLKKSLESKL